MESSIEIYVATHKPIDFALPDYCKKIQVNAEANGQWPGYLHDNDGLDNISLKNPNYCELTVLYSMWKNCKSDIQGLFHYRRYMMSRINRMTASFDELIKTAYVFPDEVRNACVTAEEIIEALKNNDIILPMPVSRSPLNVLETMAFFCRKYKYINVMRKVIRDFWPDYLLALYEVFEGEFMSVCNMFITGRKITDEYCEWLFSVLGKVENLVSNYEGKEDYARLYGYLSEILINVFVRKNNLSAKYFYKNMVRSSNDENKIIRAARKIPFLMTAFNSVRRMMKRKYHEEIRESENFSVKIRKFTGFNIYDSLFIAELTPKIDNLIPALEEILPSLNSEAKNSGMLLVPRIIISGKIPASLHEALWDIGVSIVNR